jgi:hypothetical protein
VSSSIGDDEDIYLQKVPELLWRDHSQSQMAGAIPMTMGNAAHYRSKSQLGQIQTSSFASPPVPGTTIDGFLPPNPSSTYSGSNASIYESSPSSNVDMFSPSTIHGHPNHPSGIDTPMDMSPEGYFPQIADQSMTSRHARDASMHHQNENMMFKSEMDSNMLDMPQYMHDAHITPKASSFHNTSTLHDMNSQHMMQQHLPSSMAMPGGSHGHYYSSPNPMMH